MIVKQYMLKTRSGLHCGIGQGLSDIDLPTAKEAVSGLPFVPGSSLKGVLREYFENDGDHDSFEAAFGQSGEVPEFASALSFGDARIVCLPARSYFGVFAYVSSPYSLRVLRDAAKQAGHEDFTGLPSFPPNPETYHCATTSGSVLSLPRSGGQNIDRVLLEDIDLLVDEELTEIADGWAAAIAQMVHPGEDDVANEDRELFSQRFMIVPDDVLTFLCETALPVATRIRIGEDGVVAAGALWYEEYVPPETLFTGMLAAENGRGKHHQLSADHLMDLVTARPLECQIGGGATIGRGMVHIQFS